MVDTHRLDMTLTEGKYHQVKRMFGFFNNKVVRLHRESIGPLVLDSLLAREALSATSLTEGLAMPHARPEEGAKGLGLSLLKLQQGVSFGSEEFDPVDIIIMLAAPDKHSHIEMISALAELFSSDEDMNKLHQATNIEEIKTIIARY